MLLFVTQIEMSYVKTYRIHIELNLIATLCINVEIKIEYKINIEPNIVSIKILKPV